MNAGNTDTVILSPIKHDHVDKFVGADGVAFTWLLDGRVTNYLKVTHQEITGLSLKMLAESGTSHICVPCLVKFGVFLAVRDCVCTDSQPKINFDNRAEA